MKTRRAKAKTQVAIAPRTVQAIIQVIATPQVTIHQAVLPTALPIAIQIHNHQTLLHPIHTTLPNPMTANQVHPTPNHQANHQEVPAVVAPVHGSGHAVGSCLSRTVKAPNHPRAQVAMTAR
jgi:hypothetical protein